MRSSVIKTIFKREILDIFRDRKTVFMTLVLPLLLYPIIMIGLMTIMNMAAAEMAEKELNIAFNEAPTREILDRIEGLGEDEGKLNIVEVTDYKTAIENEEISAYIEVGTENDKRVYKVYINSSIEDNKVASSRIEEIVELYKEEIVDKNISDLGLDKSELLEPIVYEEIDIAEKEQVVGSLLGTILPFILITGILTGAVYPAIDTMAGEKERGTLETLLTLPISNLELVMGKYIAVALITVLNAICSMLSMLGSMGLMVIINLNAMEMLGAESIKFDFSQLVIPGIITFICIIIFSMIIAAVTMCVCALAKSFKEAQNSTTPIMLVGMVLSYSSLIPTLKLNPTTANIPVVNIVLLIKSVLTFNYNVSLMAMVLLSNIIFMLLSVWVLSKLFNSEDVLFGSGKGFSFLDKRSDIQKGTLPTTSDGILIYSVCILILLYLSSYSTIKMGIYGVIPHQLLFAVIPILLSIYVKSDLKKVYSIKMPRIKHILGSISLWVGAFIVVNIIGNLIIQTFPNGEETAEALANTLTMPDSFIVNVILIALIPAICEEVLFRGFIFTSFKSKNNKEMGDDKRARKALLISSIMFGIMHIDFIRIVPTAMLGMAIGYIVYKSGSIFLGMLIHFINNTLAVAQGHYPESEVMKAIQYLYVDFTDLDITKLIIALVIGLIFGIIGFMLLKTVKEDGMEYNSKPTVDK